MAEDSQNEAVSGDTPVTAEATDSSVAESTEAAAPVDLSAELADIESAAARANVEAELRNLRRQAGHVPGLQAKVAELERALKGQPTTADAARWNVLIDALTSEGQISASVSEKLRLNIEGDARYEALAAELADLKAGKTPEEEAEVNARIAALEGAWQRGETLLRQYGSKAGLTAEEMPPLAEWSAVFNEDPESPTDGYAKMRAKIDERVAAKARRTERADAADGGASGTQATRKGGLTWEKARTMSREELATYPVEERDAAMARR